MKSLNSLYGYCPHGHKFHECGTCDQTTKEKLVSLVANTLNEYIGGPGEPFISEAVQRMEEAIEEGWQALQESYEKVEKFYIDTDWPTTKAEKAMLEQYLREHLSAIQKWRQTLASPAQEEGSELNEG